jgi:hypothetical protein
VSDVAAGMSGDGSTSLRGHQLIQSRTTISRARALSLVEIGGEQPEIEGTFDSPEYVMDAATLGVPKGWIIIGHNMSEESGMQEMADCGRSCPRSGSNTCAPA